MYKALSVSLQSGTASPISPDAFDAWSNHSSAASQKKTTFKKPSKCHHSHMSPEKSEGLPNGLGSTLVGRLPTCVGLLISPMSLPTIQRFWAHNPVLQSVKLDNELITKLFENITTLAQLHQITCAERKIKDKPQIHKKCHITQKGHSVQVSTSNTHP